MGWLSGYQYRKKVTISGSSGTGENYPVKLSIGSSSGGDFHLEGHCVDFPNDIRFTDDDGITLLDYWIEDPSQDPISVWVRIKDNLDDDVEIYCYYGKSGASSLSNGDDTFDFFDDFDGTTFDSKWTVFDTSLDDTHITGSANGNKIVANLPSFTDYVVQARVKTGTINNGSKQNVITVYDDSQRAAQLYVPQASTDDAKYRVGSSLYEIYGNLSTSDYYRIKIICRINSDKIDYYFYSDDWTLLGSATDKNYAYTDSDDRKIYIQAASSTRTTDVYISHLFIYKYVSPQPSFSSAGSEETEYLTCTDVVSLVDIPFGGGPIQRSCTDVLDTLSSSTLFIEASWLPGFSYRKRLTISGSSGAGAGYQVKLKIGSSSGGDFHLEGHCDNFPNDIRFTKDDGLTLLKYWIEDPNQDPITAWVKIEDNLDENVEIYCYYGSSFAESVSSGDDVFEFFDNMSGVLQDIDCISNGSERATAYEMANKIVRYGNKTHIGYLKYEGGGYKACVRTYHHDTGEWDDEVCLGSVNDNHGTPALAIDSNGYLYVFYDGHHTTLKWRKSTNPNDASSWTDAEAVPNQANYPSYPSVVIDSSNNVHLIYRSTEESPLSLYYQKYNGSSWSTTTKLAEGDSVYIPSYSCSIAIDNSDVLHVGVLFYDLPADKGKKAGYMKSDDGGSTWKKSDGTTYTLPVTYSTLETVETGDNLRLGNIAVDSNDHPFFVVIRMHNSPHDGQFWRYDGTSWIGTTLSVSGKNLYASCSTTFLNGIIYIFLHAGSSWSADDCEVYMFYSSDNGSTFTSKQISTTDSSNANWHAHAEQKNGANTLSEMRVMWTHGNSSPTEIYFAKINEDYDAELYSFGLDYVSRYTWDTTYWSDYTDDYISAPKSKHGQTTDSGKEPAEITGVNLSEKKNMPTSGVIEVNLKDLGGSEEWISIDSSNGKKICAGNHYTNRGFYRGDWANWAGYDDICVLFDGNWHKFIVRYTPTSTQIQVDDRDPVDLPTTTEVGYPTMFGLTDTSAGVANNYIVDNLFVRKYTSPEPSFSGAQAEEGPVFTCGDSFASSSLSSSVGEFFFLCSEMLNCSDASNSLLSIILASQDSLGLIDSNVLSILILLSAVDSIGVDDGCTLSFSFTSSCLDVLHVIDNASYPLSNVVSCLDSLGIQDSVSSFLSVLCQSKDNIGGADGETSQLSVERALLDILAFQDTSSYLAGVIASASDVLNVQDLNSVRLTFSCSSIDIVKNEDSGGVNVTFHLDGNDILKGADFVSGNLQVLLDSLAVFKSTDQSASSLLGFVLRSATDVLDMYDLNTATLQIFSSSIDIFRTEDDSSINITLHLNSADVLKNSDSAILRLQALLSALEILKASDSSTASVFAEILASASDLLATSDYNTVRLEFLGSVIDIVESVDNTSSNVTLHLNSSDLLGGMDRVTAKLEALLSAISKFKSSDESRTCEVIYGVPVKIFKAQHKVLVFRAE